jgi:hypothetical protein
MMKNYLGLADRPEVLKPGPGFLEMVDEINSTKPADSPLRIWANQEVAESEANANALETALEGVDDPDVRSALGYVAYKYCFLPRYYPLGAIIEPPQQS